MNDDGINTDGLYAGLKAFADAVSSLRKTVAQVLPSLIEIGKIFGEFALWAEAVDKMANAQIVFTDDFTLELAHKFCEEPDIVQAVDRYYYEGGHISPLIETLKQHDGMEMYQRFYEEIIAAFQQEHYQLACTGLFSLADGILADASDMQGCVNYEKRIKKIEERISNNEELTGLDRKFWWKTIYRKRGRPIEQKLATAWKNASDIYKNGFLKSPVACRWHFVLCRARQCQKPN